MPEGFGYPKRKSPKENAAKRGGIAETLRKRAAQADSAFMERMPDDFKGMHKRRSMFKDVESGSSSTAPRGKRRKQRRSDYDSNQGN